LGRRLVVVVVVAAMVATLLVAVPLLAPVADRLGFSARPAAAAVSWESLPSLPAERVFLGVGADRAGGVYAFGGASAPDLSSLPEGDTWRFDPGSGSWSALASMGVPRRDVASAIDFHGGLLAIGGLKEFVGLLVPAQEVSRFDPVTGAWSSVTALPSARWGAGGATDQQGLVYAIGGINGGALATGVRADLSASPPAWSSIASMSQARARFGTATDLQGRIYAIGGTTDSSGDAGSGLSSVERYTPSTNSWSSVASLPGPARSGLTAAVDGLGRIYAIGGTDTSYDALTRVDRYDPGTNAWTNLSGAPLGEARGGLAAVTVPSGQIYAVGGGDLLATDKVERYDTGVPLGPLGSPLTVDENSVPNLSERLCGACVGAPVSTQYGNFWHTFSDMSVAGRGPGLGFDRTYDSSNASVNGPLGFGWRLSYQMSVSSSGGTATVVQENGAQVRFRAVGTGFVPESPRVVAALTHDTVAHRWTFVRRAQQTFTFDDTGRLLSIADLAGNATTLTYNGAGQLATVTDASGTRTLNVGWESTAPTARITSVTDSLSPARQVTFAYTGGDLTSVTDVNGQATTFGYDGAHRVTTVTDPRGSVLRNTYDSTTSRVTRQTQQVTFGATPRERYTDFGYVIGTDGQTGITFVSQSSNYDTATRTRIDEYRSGELVTQIRAWGTPKEATWSYRYDPATLGVTAETDPLGHTATSTYDAAGNLTARTDALGRTTTSTYDAHNLVTTVVAPQPDPAHPIAAAYRTTTYARNATTGLVNTATRTLAGATPATDQNVVTGYFYDDATNPGMPTRVVDPKGKTWSFHYTPAGDVDQEIAPTVGGVAPTTLYGYDAIGRRTYMLPPEGTNSGAGFLKYIRAYTYEPSGELHQEQHPYLSKTTTYTHDAGRNLTGTTDPDGNTITYAYNAANEQTSIQRASAPAWTATYDGFGNLASQTDGKNKTTSYTHDLLDQLTGVTDPLGRATTFAYDLAGRRTSKQDPGGDCGATPATGCTTYGYDNADQPTSIDYHDSGTTGNVTFAYDGIGRRTSMADGTGTTTYTYDTLDRIVTQAAGTGRTVGYGYDLNSQVTSLTYPGSNQVTRTFDDAGRLATTADWLGHTTSFGYNLDSALTSIGSPNGITETYTRDEADQPLTVTHTGPGGTLNQFAYTRKPSANLATSTVTGGSLFTTNKTYGYTPLNQLNTLNGSPLYTNDDADNLTTLYFSGFFLTTATYDDANQLTNQCIGAVCVPFGYDSRGNRTTKTPSGGPTTTYGYDRANRLTTVTGGFAYTYDGDGLRVTKTGPAGTRTFAYDTTGTVPLTLTDTTSSYLYGPGGLPVEQITGTTPTYLQHDQLGSTRILSDQTGTVTGTYEYADYGYQNTHTGTGTTPLGYAGQYTDPETGFQYLRARYYDPGTGNFLTRDPINPITRHPYSYTEANPLNTTDPTGLITLAEIGATLRTWSITAAIAVKTIPPRVWNFIQRFGPQCETTAPAAESAMVTNTAADRAVIGKVADLQAPGAIGPSERTLLSQLPNQGSPAANWAQNSGVLRSELARGVPIRDASVNPVTGALENNSGFLRAERYLLQDRGWIYDPKTHLWMPPG